MKSSIKNRILELSLILLCYSISAQNSNKGKMLDPIDKGIDHYAKLAKLGYSDIEIFEDLGNANFLAKKYKAAIYWYTQLLEKEKTSPNEDKIHERFNFAIQELKTKNNVVTSINKDWLLDVSTDYKVKKNDKKIDYTQEQFIPKISGLEKGMNTEPSLVNNSTINPSLPFSPILLTDDGKTVFYSMAKYVKPMTGIFSKKIKVFRIFRAIKENGFWSNVEELSLCPKYYSVKHPSVSKDGKRLYFSSDMPGGFGKFDLYVADLSQNGKYGLAKNLGKKVNSKGSEIHPAIMDNNVLTFASDGREGYGGLDIYLTTVVGNRVGIASNLGNPINSEKDDFAIELRPNDKICQVVTNRNTNEKFDRLTFYVDTDAQNGLSWLSGQTKLLRVDEKNMNTELSKNLFDD